MWLCMMFLMCVMFVMFLMWPCHTVCVICLRHTFLQSGSLMMLCVTLLMIMFLIWPCHTLQRGRLMLQHNPVMLQHALARVHLAPLYPSPLTSLHL